MREGSSACFAAELLGGLDTLQYIVGLHCSIMRPLNRLISDRVSYAAIDRSSTPGEESSAPHSECRVLCLKAFTVGRPPSRLPDLLPGFHIQYIYVRVCGFGIRHRLLRHRLAVQQVC